MISPRQWFLSFMLIVVATPAFATGPALTYHGRLYHNDGTPVATSVQFKIQIRSPGAESCLLYEETQTQDLTATSGIFALDLNNGTGTRTDGGSLTVQQILSNQSTMTFTGGTCASGTTYTPASTDGRSLVVFFNDGTLSGWEQAPAQALNFAPKAIDAMQVEGFGSSSLVRVANSSGPQAVAALTPSNFTELMALINGTSTEYMQSSATNGTNLPVLSATPASPIAGQMWYDSVSNQIEYYNGTGTQSLGVSSGTVSSVSTGTGLTGGPITTSGTIAVDVGTTANKILQLNGSAQIPAVDGSLLTNLNGSSIASGTIGGTTAITTSGNISAQNVSANGASFRALVLNDAGSPTPNTATLQAPTAITTPYILTLPAALPGSSGQMLVTDTSGNLSWGSADGAVPGGSASGDLSGSYPGPTVAKIQGVAVSSTPPSAAGQVLVYNGTTQYAPVALSSLAFLQNGNSFGSTAVLGTVDSNKLELETHGSVGLTMDTSQNVGIGTSSPASALDVKGVFRLEGSTAGYSAFQSPTTAGNVTWTLPTGDGSPGQVLKTDGLGTLSWINPTSGSVTSVGTGTGLSGGPITGTGTISLAAPTTSTIGGVEAINAVSHEWINSINTSGVPQLSQPAFSDLSGSLTAAQLPTFSGDATVSGTGVVTVTGIQGQVVNSTAATDAQLDIYNGTTNKWTAVSLSGDATIANTGVVTLKSVGTANTYTKVTTDAEGRVTSGSNIGATDVNSFAFVNGGNSFGAATTVGTNDSNNLGFRTNNAVHMTLDTSGNLGIGSTSPAASLDMGQRTDAIILPGSGTHPASPVAGMFRYNTGNLEYYNGSGWTTLSSSSGSVTSVGTGTGLSGGPITGSGTISLANPTTSTIGGVEAINAVSHEWINSINTSGVPQLSQPAFSDLTGSLTAAQLPTFSGDATVSNTGVVTVTGIQGQVVNNAAATDAQMHVYNGTTNKWNAVSLSGDATIANTGVVTLKSVGTANTYTKVTTDAEGRVTSGSTPATLSGLGVTDAVFDNGGNSFGVATAIGTNDGNNLGFRTNNAVHMTLDTSGNLGIGSTSPAASLDMGQRTDAIILPGSGTHPASPVAGMFRYNTGNLEYYNGSGWVTLSSSSGSVTSVGTGTGLSGGPITGSGTISLANPTTSTIGGVEAINAVSHEWINSINTSGVPQLSQPAFSDLSGSLTAAQLPALTAADIWVGSNLNVATAVAPSGDVSLSNAGAFTVTGLNGKALSIATLATGNYLRYNGTNWANANLQSGDITTALGYTPINSGQMPASCGANETLTFSSPSGSWTCSNIGITGSAFTAQNANLILAGPTTGVAATPAFRALVSADLPATGATGAYLNGGNSFGQAAKLGTADSNTLAFVTGGSTAMTITTAQKVGIGTPSPGAMLEINGTAKIDGSITMGSATNIDWGSSYGQAALYLYDTGAGARWGWGLNAGEMQFFSTTGATNRFTWNKGGDFQATGTNEMMRLTQGASGTFLGIGTTTPANGLDVVGSVAIGSYAGTAASSNGLIVSGNVGVANSSPTAAGLQVSTAGAASLSGEKIDGAWYVAGTGTTNKPQLLVEPSGTASTTWSTSGTGLGVNASTGFTGNLLDAQLAGTSEFKVSSGGNVTALGSYTGTAFFYSSDARLKHNIETIPNSLDSVLQLRGVTFNWNKDNSPEVGLIAQEVEQVYPQLVGETAAGTKAVKYGNLVAPLIEAVKELYHMVVDSRDATRALASQSDQQAAQINELNAKVQQLQSDNQNLRDEISQIKAMLEKQSN